MKEEDELARLRDKGVPGRRSSLSNSLAVKMVHMKGLGTGPQHLFKRCNAREGAQTDQPGCWM